MSRYVELHFLLALIAASFIHRKSVFCCEVPRKGHHQTLCSYFYLQTVYYQQPFSCLIFISLQPFPRKDFTEEDMDTSLKDLGLVPNGSLNVQKKEKKDEQPAPPPPAAEGV